MEKNDLLYPALFRTAQELDGFTEWSYFGATDIELEVFTKEEKESLGIYSFVKDGLNMDIYTGDTLYQYCGVTDTVQFYRVVYEQGVIYAKTKIRVTSKDKVEIKDVKMTLKGMDSKSLFIAGNDVEGIYENYREEFEEYINYLTEGLGLE